MVSTLIWSRSTICSICRIIPKITVVRFYRQNCTTHNEIWNEWSKSCWKPLVFDPNSVASIWNWNEIECERYPKMREKPFTTIFSMMFCLLKGKFSERDPNSTSVASTARDSNQNSCLECFWRPTLGLGGCNSVFRLWYFFRAIEYVF